MRIPAVPSAFCVWLTMLGPLRVNRANTVPVNVLLVVSRLSTEIELETNPVFVSVTRVSVPRYGSNCGISTVLVQSVVVSGKWAAYSRTAGPVLIVESSENE